MTVRPSGPLQLDFAAIDTLCDDEPAIDLLEYITPSTSVDRVAGQGVTGYTFNPASKAMLIWRLSIVAVPFTLP